MMRSTGLETAARTSCTSDPGDWAADTACSTAWVRYTRTQAQHTAINVDGKYQTGTFYGCCFFVMIPDISKHLMQPNNSMHLQSSSDEAHKLKARFKNMKLCNN